MSGSCARRSDVVLVRGRVTGITARAGGVPLTQGAGSLKATGLTRTKSHGPFVPFECARAGGALGAPRSSMTRHVVSVKLAKHDSPGSGHR